MEDVEISEELLIPAGRHTLDASNIPFLGQLIDKFTGGNVFICEVFFVTTREMPAIKFGTSIGDVQDPQTQLRVRIMVYGEFSARVIDPVKLVIGLVGQRATDNEQAVGWFKSQVQKTMKDGIAELIVKQSWPLMKVTSGAYTEEIEATETTLPLLSINASANPWASRSGARALMSKCRRRPAALRLPSAANF